ncbi:UGSC family (seleno)protein [Phytoactinopolyspora endophytica]|uniref:UGSC family (seleno)protein n=1 Tax=Phytoactinopolyspora endophytica TaxID=1642495 RepID=UPI00197B0774|nr:UGSC family (seleno)protein [Phytoactinopolyspora endophytica]
MVGGIIDPTAGAQTRVSVEQRDSPVVSSLDGLRVGLLENTKRNAARILDAVGAALAETHGAAELVRRTKKQFAMPLPSDVLTDLKSTCDVVVIGVGDCGSCSASAVADGIALEETGLPTAVICTDAFESTARAMAELKGDADYGFLLTEHPVANLTDEQIVQRAGRLAPEVAARLLGRRSSGVVA